MGKIEIGATGVDLGSVASGPLVALSAQSIADLDGQQRRAIVISFAASHHDRVAVPIDLLYPQRQAFEPSAVAPGEYFREEGEEWSESFEPGLDLAAREDCREVLGSTGALQTLQGRHFQAEDAFVEEDEGAKGLRGRDATLHGEVVQEGRGFEGAPVSGVAAVVEAEERADPVEVRLLGLRQRVQSLERIPHGFEEGHDEIAMRVAEMSRGGSIFSMRGHGGRQVREEVPVVLRAIGVELGAG